jgi:RIO kinase 1
VSPALIDADERYHQSHIYIIDVSQSVEHDHPRAYDFLRNDIRNVHDFFSKQTRILGMRRMWDFITEDSVGVEDETGDEGELRLLEKVHCRLAEPADDSVVDTIFMTSYIPRNLGDVYDPERDVEMLNAGKGDELIYAGTTGLKDNLSTQLEKNVRFEDEDEDEDEGEGSGDSSDDVVDKQPRGHRHEDKAAKKVCYVSFTR